MPLLIALTEFPSYTCSPREIAKCEQVLETQGQIEPLVLDAAGFLGTTHWYDPVYVEAARNLGWDTLLVTWPGEGRIDL